MQTLYGYGMRFTPDTEIIKDCIQDLFASLYRNRERLATSGNVKLYLFVSLKNNLIKALYKEDRYTRYSSEMTCFALDATVEVMKSKGFSLNETNLICPIPQKQIDVNPKLTQKPVRLGIIGLTHSHVGGVLNVRTGCAV